MPKFKFVNLVRLAILAIDFSGFPIFWGCRGVLRLDYIGDLFYFATSICGGDYSDLFLGFLSFPVY